METVSRRDREKLFREGEIIAAAERVFHARGYEAASMDEIAREAQFTKRTLYQYFENKEELYLAVVLKGFKSLFEYLSQVAEPHEKGFIRIQKTCKGYYEFFRDNAETFRTISYWGHVKKKASAESKKKYELAEFNNIMFESVARVIEEGKADGSIKPDLDSNKAAFSLVFMMTGFMNQLSATGESFTQHFSLDIEDFSLYTIDMLLETLKNTADMNNKK
ncbi:MAG: TetR family transcriptional regulator [Eubacterium sp.]|jgi:AcrR family transcriptional regulator|nr:TetR family transcriptional regulator [Eubacterium sp.]